MTERLFRDYDLREEMEARRRRLRFVKSVMTRAAAKSGVGSGTLRVGSPANINAPSVAGCSTRMVPDRDPVALRFDLDSMMNIERLRLPNRESSVCAARLFFCRLALPGGRCCGASLGNPFA